MGNEYIIHVTQEVFVGGGGESSVSVGETVDIFDVIMSLIIMRPHTRTEIHGSSFTSLIVCYSTLTPI